ncbi:MAG: type II toxin-antitoxin system RelE/ParE family toxin [Daejeonella sp.]
MPEYVVYIKRSAQKELAKLSLPLLEKCYKLFDDLSLGPRPVGNKKLAGFKNLYRLRLNDYRIIYSIQDDELIIHILKVGHRKNVYKF